MYKEYWGTQSEINFINELSNKELIGYAEALKMRKYWDSINKNMIKIHVEMKIDEIRAK